MKYSFLIVVVFVVAIVACLCAPTVPKENADYLRIHIRADSNDEKAQNVKYKVKAAVVDYLTPLLVGVSNKSDAVSRVSSCLDELETVANTVLADEGFDYKCRADVRAENFPCRTYGSLTLQSGVYDALILQLGSGKGDNWWCVVYPPLCFVGGESNGTNSIVYRSFLKEVIEKFLAEHN